MGFDGFLPSFHWSLLVLSSITGITGRHPPFLLTDFFTNSQEVQDLKILDTVAAASCNMDAYHHIITIHGSTYTAK